MNRLTMALLLAAALLGGCSSGPPPEVPPQLPAKLGRASYWYAQPDVATVQNPDYDRLWNTCDYVAHRELFYMDVEDYREGVMVTQPLISKQIFEFWRPDTGNVHEAIQNSLQSIRRTIRFEFSKTAGGEYRVTPKVLVEQLAQTNARITSPLQYQGVFAPPAVPDQDETGAQGHYVAPRWYAIGRDTDMEKQLAQDITEDIK